MSSRAEQKAAARAAREAKQREANAARTRRTRLLVLAGLVAVVAVVLVAIVVGSGGGKTVVPPKHKTAIAAVKSLLAGIPESGNTLGDPSAPVTITEYGDLVCPICFDFATTSEAQLIQSEVRSGHAKLVFRGFETASATANGGEYINTQVAALSAGLQGKAWYYILLTYEEQPQTINGAPAEQAPYITPAYLQGLAAQVPGLNLSQWQVGLTNQTLANAVTADTQAANAAGVTGTPTIFVSGPKGTKPFVGTSSAVPTLAQLQTLIGQVG